MKNHDYLFAKIAEKISEEALGSPTDYPPTLFWDEELKDEDVRKAVVSCRSNIFGKYLGLYIHIPFCESKCFYCRTISEVCNSREKIAIFLRAIKKEIDVYSGLLNQSPIRTIYFGGGTPSILASQQLEDLFLYLHKHFNLTQKAQIAFEGHPSSLDEEKLKILKEFGVNRLTLGIQSLNFEVLMSNNRPQERHEVADVYRTARRVGIEHISIDLMAGIIGQTVENFMEDLREIIAWKPDVVHINRFYPTTYTTFSRTGHRLSAEDLQAIRQMQEGSRELLKKEGYNDYGIESRALSFEARNVQLSDVIQFNSSYIGLGAAATGHLTGDYRYSNVKSVDAYITSLDQGRLPIEKGIRLNTEEEVIYYIFANLWIGKVSKKSIRLLFERDIEDFPQLMEKLRHLEMINKIQINNKYIETMMRSTAEWWIYSQYFFSDALQQKIFSLAAREGIQDGGTETIPEEINI